MTGFVRTAVIVAACIASLALVPMFASAAQGGRGAVQGRSSGFQSTVPGTVPGTSTPAPLPTPTPATAQPTAVPAEVEDDDRSVAAAAIGQRELKQVTGDPLTATIYGLTENGWLYRSPDNGRIWRLITTDPFIEDFILSPADPEFLYSGQGLNCGAADAKTAPFYRSIDGGLSWQTLPAGDNLRPLLAHPTEAETLFAADCDMIYLTTDGGETWMPTPDASAAGIWDNYSALAMTASPYASGSALPTWEALYAVGGNETGAGVVAFSGAAGESWDRLTPTSNPRPANIGAIAADPAIAGRLWFADNGGVWATDDFGATWDQTYRGLNRLLASGRGGTALNDLIYSAGMLYLAADGGLFMKGVDEPAWTVVTDRGIAGLPVRSLLLTDSNSQTLWLNAKDGVYKFSLR